MPSISSSNEARSIATSENVANTPRRNNRSSRGTNAVAPLPYSAVSAVAVEAGGMGNCFFYSLYEALAYNGLLRNVCKSLNLSDKKEQFNIGFRALLASNMHGDYSQIIDILCAQVSAGEDIAPFLEEFSREQQIMLGSLNERSCSRKDELVKNLLHSISKNFVYVAQPEVDATKRILLETCGLYLDVKSRELRRLVPFDNRIVLYNIGGGHYQWFKLSTHAGVHKTRRQRNKRRQTRIQRK